MLYNQIFCFVYLVDNLIWEGVPLSASVRNTVFQDQTACLWPVKSPKVSPN